MMREHQRPGRQRHQFPGKKEGEGIRGEDDSVHSRKEGGIKWQYAQRLVLMLSVTERVEARSGSTEVDDGQEEGAQRIDMEICTNPGQAEGQFQIRLGKADEQMRERGRHEHERSA